MRYPFQLDGRLLQMTEKNENKSKHEGIQEICSRVHFPKQQNDVLY